MDVDPLADTVPPRYAIESDEEEDEYNPLSSSAVNPNDNPSALSVRIVGNLQKGRGLMVVSGEGGKYWAKGAKLGQQTGTVQANNVEVGLVFNPPWTNATVIVSEALNRLPVWAQHGYALRVIDHLEPSRVSLLDTYSATTYITPKPTPVHEAPIRYLQTDPKLGPQISAEATPFDPPNLIQSTSASFMSILSISKLTSGTLILLPSAHVPPPAPRTILQPDISRVQENSDEWSSRMMNTAQHLLISALGEEGHFHWVPKDEKTITGMSRRKSRIADTGMYI
ncbi:hypothetical protein AX17_004779 [Amanita inopinata Kibby_2008]|nr:hypothetical protein AX17_004779 [Amanita inopinata Kibby_2008]